MSDDTHTPRSRLPAAVQALLRPWWEQRAADLAQVLEAAVQAGETTAEYRGRRYPVDRIVEMAERAVEIADSLEGG